MHMTTVYILLNYIYAQACVCVHTQACIYRERHTHIHVHIFHTGKGESVLILVNQMLISFSNRLTHTPRNILPAICVFLTPVKLTH